MEKIMKAQIGNGTFDETIQQLDREIGFNELEVADELSIALLNQMVSAGGKLYGQAMNGNLEGRPQATTRTFKTLRYLCLLGSNSKAG